MKTTLLTLVLLLMASLLQGQNLAGNWNGILDVQGTQLHVVFHITKEGDTYKATMDSPDQYVSGIPVTLIAVTYSHIKIEMANIGMVYEGTLSDNQITGKWMQSGRSFPLVLSRIEGQD
ncbi:hypothetical protein [Chryseosolibacter indicus]|uniref:Alpha/beta hydrolase n=1 Tax=Chryseosolibacter indicus TaxID=2782351 RepID=A0ABS5W0P8_9BACT|nr:hypothetical protein [Chryseosolibacter indicus]MBT1705856.1 hypothetical protein [Chryseosolibacter indicus]